MMQQQKVQNFFQLMMQAPQFMENNPSGLRELLREVAITFDMGDKFDQLWPEQKLAVQNPMTQGPMPQPPQGQQSQFSAAPAPGGFRAQQPEGVG
jgi:hypothetical protein